MTQPAQLKGATPGQRLCVIAASRMSVLEVLSLGRALLGDNAEHVAAGRPVDGKGC